MYVAHFSDPHLLSLTGARGRDFANKRWIGALNLLVSRARHHQVAVFEAMVEDLNGAEIDHIVCTGDVTNLALEEEFRFARNHFDRLELGSQQITVIPGNHDTYVAEGAKFFDQHFADYFSVPGEWQWPDGDPWPIVRPQGDLAVIGVCTGRATPWFTAYGKVGEKQLERLRTVLTDSRLQEKFRMIAIHHSPVGQRSKSRVRGLHDGLQFAEIVADAGAELVLHGHEHIDLKEEILSAGGSRIPVWGIPSATYEAGKPALRARYRIYEIGSSNSRPALVSDTVRVWSPEFGRFEKAA